MQDANDFTAVEIARFASTLNLLIARVVVEPGANDLTQQDLLRDHFIGKILEKRGKGLADKATKSFKESFARQLKNPTIDPIILIDAGGFELSAKVAAPRNSFDLDAFLALLAEKFDVSLFALLALATSCTKQSAAPISFDISLVTAKGKKDD
jgi:hypothetical protein